MLKILEKIKSHKKLVILVAILVLAIAVLFVINRSESNTTAQTVSVTYSEKEEKLAQVLQSIKGVGQTQVLIYEEESTITGVVIVCEGADSIWVKNDILNVVSTAFNIEKGIIAIYSMK
jgi:hypothetical protein